MAESDLVDLASSTESFDELPPAPDIAHTFARIVANPRKRSGHVVLKLCRSTGAITEQTVTRSMVDVRAYKQARKAHWGDLWMFDDALRDLPPPNAKPDEEDEEFAFSAVNDANGEAVSAIQ